MTRTSNGGLKRLAKAIETGFRTAIVYPLFRRLLRRSPINDVIDLGTVSKVLILRYDRIGDSIVTTPIFRKLKKVNPNVTIGVFVSPLNADLIGKNPHVDHVFVLYRNPLRLLSEARKARRDRYELLLNFIFNRTTTVALLSHFLCPKGITVSQGDPKYAFYFNRFVTLPRNTMHMTELLALYMQQIFGITFAEEELEHEMPSDPQATSLVNDFLHTHGIARREEARALSDAYVVFNISSTDRERSVSDSQVRHLIDHFGRNHSAHLVVISSPKENDRRSRMAGGRDSDRCHQFPPSGTASIMAVASLLGGAVCVITPDTGIVHIAAAMKTPVLGFFTPLQSPTEWSPFRVKCEMVLAAHGEPVSAIDHGRLADAVDHFVREVAESKGITTAGGTG